MGMKRPPGTTADRGSAVVEIVLLAPVLLLFVFMVIFGGRWAIAQQAVQAAASEAARAASLARAPTEAAGHATSAATTSLSNQKVRCSPLGATVDTSGFAAAVGTDATVSATVTCVVDMSDITAPGIPGSRTLTSTATSPLDTYRGRSG